MADDKKHAEIDAALVRQLAEILNETDLTEVEVERGELRIRVAREVTVNAAPVQYAAAPAPARQPSMRYCTSVPASWPGISPRQRVT